MSDAELILMKVSICEKDILLLKDKIAKLRDMQTRITSQLGSDVVQGTRSKSKLEDITVNLVTLEEELEAEKAKLPFYRLQAQIIINSIQDDKQRKILEDKYVNGKSWNQIAAENNMTKRNVYMIKRKAIKCYGRK